MKISLGIIVKNEEKLLESFLNHHKSLVDEIIIVDTGSNDKTKEIAKKFTNKVFDFDWKDNFSEARNYSISKATKDWILWLDPDEIIKKKDFKRIKELIKENYDGISFIQKTFTKNKSHPRYKNGYYKRRICKLFRKGPEFIYPIHETVANSIKNIYNSKIIIEHNSIESKEKSEYYIRLLEKKKRLFPDSNAEKEIEIEKTY